MRVVFPGEPFLDGKVVPYDDKYHSDWIQVQNCDERKGATHPGKAREKQKGKKVLLKACCCALASYFLGFRRLPNILGELKEKNQMHLIRCFLDYLVSGSSDLYFSYAHYN